MGEKKEVYGEFVYVDIPKEVEAAVDYLRKSILEQCDNPQDEQIIIKFIEGNETDKMFGMPRSLQIAIKVLGDKKGD